MKKKLNQTKHLQNICKNSVKTRIKKIIISRNTVKLNRQINYIKNRNYNCETNN